MENMLDSRLYPKDCITLDGRMDEAVWAEAKAFTGFRNLTSLGGDLVAEQTTFKILPCEDRLYIGVRCEEPDVPYLLSHCESDFIYVGDHVELFFSPAGSNAEFYQFFVTAAHKTACFYYEEGGFIKPDPYEPEWKSAAYIGEDFWSCEVEIPLTAFYMTRNHRWQDKWLMNVTRTRNQNGVSYTSGGCVNSTWSPLKLDFFEPAGFNSMGGFPMRPLENDVYISAATTDMKAQTESGYQGNLIVRTTNAVAGEFEFSTDYTDPIRVSLHAGENEFSVPCAFEKLIRYPVAMKLKRLSDGMEFCRTYPVLVTYEPIRLTMTLPEFRNNFYPGQDYSKVVGKAVSNQPITLKLEGPGIETQIITPDAEGNFTFHTPNFEEGDAFLTATIDGCELVKKIRRLPPSKHRMAWISGGNLVIDGKPVIRRNIYSDGWRGGEVFRRKYRSEEQYQTPQAEGFRGYIRIDALMPGVDSMGGEALQDVMPCEAMLRKIDEAMERNKDKDFTYYYIADEPECRNVSPIYLKNLYDYIAEKDPYHVISMASRGADKYIECADWFETHPYINPVIEEDGSRIYGRPINTIGRYIDDIAKFNRPDKCIGFLPTSFSYKFVTLAGDYPTFDEMLCHVWAATVRGSKTLWPFAYMDLPDRAAIYEGTRYVFSSHEALEDLILFGKRTTILNTPEVEAARFDMEDKRMFVLVNKVPESQHVVLDGIEGTWCEFRRARDITTNVFDLKPFEVVIGTSEDLSGDLPTYEEVKAICDNHDYKRTHCKSLLYERRADIDITASIDSRSYYKLFDGVEDDLGWEHAGEGHKFVELGLTKIKPTFSKISICGWHLDTMEVTVRNGGELTKIEAVAETSEEFKRTFTLKEPICPDALRLDFPDQQLVELYEIDLFV